MNNEMKLIKALCDELGFDIRQMCVNTDAIRERKANMTRMGQTGNLWNGIDYSIEPIYEYKLKKKEDVVTLPVQGDAWAAIVRFVLSHKNDI
jgi:hypothetical protein